MAKFKKGDKVRVVKGSGFYLHGQVYTISDPNAGSYSTGYVKFAELDAAHPHHNCDEDRLELVHESKEYRYRRTASGTGMTAPFGTAEAAMEHIRLHGSTDREYEIVEVRVVKTVTPRRTLEAKQ